MPLISIEIDQIVEIEAMNVWDCFGVKAGRTREKEKLGEVHFGTFWVMILPLIIELWLIHIYIFE